jgi:hypothetical protein
VAEPAGPNTINPLLNGDGTPRLCPNWPCVVIERAGVGAVLSNADGDAGVGGHRETRVLHERRPRRYQVTVDPAVGRSQGEVEMLRQAFVRTRGGSIATRWRSPDDAAGTVEEAPRWRLLNAGIDGDLSVERYVGGVAGKLSVVLEEV